MESEKILSEENLEKQPSEAKAPKHLLKAYANLKFLNSADARPIRILAEYLEPLNRLRKHKIKDTVVFYGSARTLAMEQAQENLANWQEKAKESKPKVPHRIKSKIAQAEHDIRMARYYEDARELAKRLTKWSMKLEESQRFIVCSGGGPGIMEAANRGASEAGGQTIGMNISIESEQFPNDYIDEDLSFEFHYFFMRKFWFVYMAKALVIFPGGFGTMDELFELLTLRQTQKVKKPVSVIIYDSEYWNSIIDFKKLVEWGTISKKDLKLFSIVDSVDRAFEILRNNFEERFVGKKKYWHL